MLFNPFFPSQIAKEPDQFFGRNEELHTLGWVPDPQFRSCMPYLQNCGPGTDSDC